MKEVVVTGIQGLEKVLEKITTAKRQHKGIFTSSLATKTLR